MNDRRSHADLLDQVETDQATRDAVRRILAAPLTEDELDRANIAKAEYIAQEHRRWKSAPWPVGATNHVHRFSACQSGPCKQGRRPCPSPQQCMLPDADDTRPPPRAGDMLRVVVLVLACWAAVALTLVAITGVTP